MVETSGSTDTTIAALQALRKLGAPQREPLRFHHVSALARRTAALAGPVRQLLDTRLAAALADLQQRLSVADTRTPTTPATPATPDAASNAAPMPGPLASLLRSPSAADRAGLPPELRAVQRFASTWAQLRVDQQLRRSLTRQPDNAGPLNSQRLMLQTLQQLRGLSPAYLQRFMAHAEALLWLQDSSAVSTTNPGKRTDAERPRRPVRRGKP